MTKQEALSKAAKLALKTGKDFVAIRFSVKHRPLKGGQVDQWIIATSLKIQEERL